MAKVSTQGDTHNTESVIVFLQHTGFPVLALTPLHLETLHGIHLINFLMKLPLALLHSLGIHNGLMAHAKQFYSL